MDQLYDTEPGQPRVPLRATPEGYLIVQIAGGGGGGGSSVTNLTTTVSPTNVVVASDTGTDATIPLADVTNAGAMPPAAVTQLAGLGTASEADVEDFAPAGHTHALLMTTNERTKLGALPAAADLTTSLAGKMANTLPAMQTVFNAGTAPEKAAFQASVSGGGRRYKLGGRCGLLASPIATATVAGALIFALPESIKIPAGSGGANSRIYYDVRVRRQVAAAAATNVIVRFGPANSNSDPACGLLSLPITLNSDGRAFGSIDAASNTAVSYNSYGAINGATTAAAQDVTAGINFGVDQYLNIGISGTNGDQVSLIAYSFYLEV